MRAVEDGPRGSVAIAVMPRGHRMLKLMRSRRSSDARVGIFNRLAVESVRVIR